MKAMIYEGVLTTYYETGMEGGIGLHLFMDIDKYKTKNPNYDPADPKKGPPFYHSWDGTFVAEKRDQIEILDCPVESLKKYNGKKFQLGNLRWAAKDHYRFGGAYPTEEIPLQDWYDLFACEQTRAKLIRPLRNVAYYGGTFDPVHHGHLKIIQELAMKSELVLVMPGNNWTKNPPIFSIDERIASLDAVCDRFPNVKALDWAKENEFDTSSTFEVVKKIEEVFEIRPNIVIGSDNVKNIEKWKNWDKLKSYRFVIFNRGEKLTNEELLKFKEPIYWSQFDPSPLSSTEIRKSNSIDGIPKEAHACLELSKLTQNEK